MMLVLNFNPSGTCNCLYSELIDLGTLGALAVRRASNVEFNSAQQQWEVRDLDG